MALASTSALVCLLDLGSSWAVPDYLLDIYFRTGELGYWISEEHWGKGVMSQVVPAFVQYVWKTFDILIRLNGSVNEANKGSAKCLEKAGFVFEGRREAMNCKCGVVQAELMYGALRPKR